MKNTFVFLYYLASTIIDSYACSLFYKVVFVKKFSDEFSYVDPTKVTHHEKFDYISNGNKVVVMLKDGSTVQDALAWIRKWKKPCRMHNLACGEKALQLDLKDENPYIWYMGGDFSDREDRSLSKPRKDSYDSNSDDEAPLCDLEEMGRITGNALGITHYDRQDEYCDPAA